MWETTGPPPYIRLNARRSGQVQLTDTQWCASTARRLRTHFGRIGPNELGVGNGGTEDPHPTEVV